MSDSRAAAQIVAKCLLDAGHEVYFAGGCVRDRVLGMAAKDCDLATSARPDEILRWFPKAQLVGAHFGVVVVRQGEWMVDVATFRTDGNYADGRHPESVQFATAEEDAQRRDFTINALFEHPLTGEIRDFVGGMVDLERKILRAVGVAERRFEEDALRLMRAIRFATTHGLEIEAETWRAIGEKAGLIRKISMERIRDEFSKILCSKHRVRGVEMLVESGLMAEFFPEFLALRGCEQPPQWHPEGDVYQHTKMMLGMLAADASLVLVLAVLLHDIGKPATYRYDEELEKISFHGHDAVGGKMAREILGRMKYSNEVVDAVVPMVERHMQFMHVRVMRVAKLKRFMSSANFAEEMELHRVDCASSNGILENYEFLREKQDEFSREPLIPEPLVTGRDLIRIGLPPGPKFREILEKIQTEQLEGRARTREDGLALLEQWTRDFQTN